MQLRKPFAVQVSGLLYGQNTASMMHSDAQFLCCSCKLPFTLTVELILHQRSTGSVSFRGEI